MALISKTRGSIVTKIWEKPDYEKIRNDKRFENDCYEGDKVMIITSPARDSEQRCMFVTVVSVHEHHVVIRFPYGYQTAFTWHDFNQMRV